MNKRRQTYKPIPTLLGEDECNAWLKRHDKSPTYVYRGDVWYANLGRNKFFSEQEGKRPVLIISNNANNRFSHTVTVVPFTGVLKHTELPTHVVIEAGNGWESEYPSMALAEQVTTIDKHKLIRKMGQIKDAAVLKKIEQAVQIQIGAEG